MKKVSKKWVVRGSALAMAALCLGGSAALAVNGDKNDPLVTLSYLNQTALPKLIEQVEKNTAVHKEELKKTFEAQINQYIQQGGGTGNNGGTGGTGGSSSAGFTLVTLTKGQKLSLEVGCEMLLRIGTASVSAQDDPALIDVSAGKPVNSGSALEKNHLYMATISGRTIIPTSDTVKLLVRGNYLVS